MSNYEALKIKFSEQDKQIKEMNRQKNKRESEGRLKDIISQMKKEREGSVVKLRESIEKEVKTLKTKNNISDGLPSYKTTKTTLRTILKEEYWKEGIPLILDFVNRNHRLSVHTNQLIKLMILDSFETYGTVPWVNTEMYRVASGILSRRETVAKREQINDEKKKARDDNRKNQDEKKEKKEKKVDKKEEEEEEKKEEKVQSRFGNLILEDSEENKDKDKTIKKPRVQKN